MMTLDLYELKPVSDKKAGVLAFIFQDSMFSDDSDVEVDDAQLTINEHYAKAFEYRKEREELAKREHPLNLSA